MRAFVLIVTIGALSISACSSSSSHSSPTSSAPASSSGGSSSASGGPSTKGCPTSSVVTTVMGSTFTGPVTGTAGGTAPCVYSGSGGTQVNVLFNAPGLSESQFASQAKSDMGATTAAVSGVGGAAYASTAFGHAEIEAWRSDSDSFSITIDTSDATVQPNNAAQAEALAKAILAG
jgi:hypothetical protein